ncbi:unnamed protein product [Diatraea saccharalis]|uniref:Uncharacterized protein n=1 Tax=Diatraea saccharalis TaxID=40085 RepID=A0A9N9N4M6_9NEOP|nr:unnamed protein product [Diatraea saccharalis]
MNTEYETINENVVNWKTFMRQLAVNSVSSVFDILVGVGTGAPTVIIPQLRKNANTTESITDDMASWASSANQFSGVSWVIILTTMAHFLGRKKTMMFLNSLLNGLQKMENMTSVLHLIDGLKELTMMPKRNWTFFFLLKKRTEKV